jgi:hypothetical protein
MYHVHVHLKLPALKPRNGVVRALISKLNFGAGWHKPKVAKRKQAADDADLAQRVREVGEW